MARVNLDRVLPVLGPMIGGMLRGVQARREALFAAVPQAPGRVVFLGDSITEQGAWAEWFPELATSNRGIGGQTVDEIAARLDTALVAPRAVSLLAGTNDFHMGRQSRVPAAVAGRLRVLVRRIRQQAPDARLIVNGVFPRSTLFRDRILELNAAIRRDAEANDATYLDLWPALATPDGAIRPELTSDGLHLSNAGYAAWVAALRPHLAPFAA